MNNFENKLLRYTQNLSMNFLITLENKMSLDINLELGWVENIETYHDSIQNTENSGFYREESLQGFKPDYLKLREILHTASEY